jgi:hypothetical protein
MTEIEYREPVQLNLPFDDPPVETVEEDEVETDEDDEDFEEDDEELEDDEDEVEEDSSTED